MSARTNWLLWIAIGGWIWAAIGFWTFLRLYETAIGYGFGPQIQQVGGLIALAFFILASLMAALGVWAWRLGRSV